MKNKQIIYDENNNPAFVVIPYSEFISDDANVFLPFEVVSFNLINNYTLIKSWRLYLGYTQKQVAEALNITQPAYAQIEKADNPHLKTIEKIAKFFKIDIEQLTN